MVFIFIAGLIVGSFLEAYTFRAPQGIKIGRGRSFCPHCKSTISWHDNIPLLSFLMLSGKCRVCHQPIPRRAPTIELATAILFLTTHLNQPLILQNFPWLKSLSPALVTFYLLLTIALLLATLITDLEHQIVLDETIFLGFIVTLLILLATSSSIIYFNLVSAFSASLFLLLLHLITRGHGMGLGDVKLALFLALFLGLKYTLLWLFLSFIIGALVGLVFLAFGKKKLSDKIAFGPFLVLSFFLCLFFAQELSMYIIPFYVWS